MIKKIIAFIKGNKNTINASQNFFELPSKKQKKIIIKAVRDANKEQLDMVKRYDERFGSIKTNRCKV